MHIKFQMFETKQVQSNGSTNSILHEIIGEYMYAVCVLILICYNKAHSNLFSFGFISFFVVLDFWISCPFQSTSPLKPEGR